MLLRTVRMTFRPDAVAPFLALFREARPKISAADGCEALALWADPRYPNVLTTVSTWQSRAHLDAYRHSELFETTWAKTKPMFAARPVAHSHVPVAAEPPAERDRTPADPR